MKRAVFLIYLTVLILGQFGNPTNINARNVPDSVYLFGYSTQKNAGHNGLHFAWSTDQENWTPIGPEFRFLFCDYGRWGVEKRMVTTFLFHGHDGIRHCIWSVNEKDGAFAHAESKDLVHWKPQSYPIFMENNNCLEPEISYDTANSLYTISWLSTAGDKKQALYTTTIDFKNYSPSKEMLLSD